MADPSQKGKADKYGAWYLAYRAGDVDTAWRWQIEYTPTAPGNSGRALVDSAEVDPASIYESKADAIAAAKKFAAARHKVNTAASAPAAPADGDDGDASGDDQG